MFMQRIICLCLITLGCIQRAWCKDRYTSQGYWQVFRPDCTKPDSGNRGKSRAGECRQTHYRKARLIFFTI